MTPGEKSSTIAFFILANKTFQARPGARFPHPGGEACLVWVASGVRLFFKMADSYSSEGGGMFLS